jgi:hypothetical protein
MAMKSNGKNRGFYFYLRDLFWLTLVSALLFAWWTDRKQDKALIAQDNASIAKLD